MPGYVSVRAWLPGEAGVGKVDGRLVKLLFGVGVVDLQVFYPEVRDRQVEGIVCRSLRWRSFILGGDAPGRATRGADEEEGDES